MSDQLQLTLETTTGTVRGEVVHFPVERLVGRARRDALDIFKKPEGKRRWHLDVYVRQVRDAYTTDLASLGFAVRQSEIYQLMLVNELNKIGTLRYLFGEVAS